MTRKIWYQLVDDENGRTYAGILSASVRSGDIQDMDDLREKIHAEYDHTKPHGTNFLASISANQLKIYANRNDYTTKTPLPLSTPLKDLGEHEDGALIVAIPPPPAPAVDLDSNKRLRLESEPRMEKLELVAPIQIHGADYLTLPAGLLEKCGYKVSEDLMLYCRQEMLDLWRFLENEVIAKNTRGFIVGPPGTGKSVSTLSFVAQLDPKEWNVVWVHLGTTRISCCALASKTYWYTNFRSPLVGLSRMDGKKLLVCLDGYQATETHKNVLADLASPLKEDEKLVVCSSMATLGKFNTEDVATENIGVFFVYSWTQAQYFQAIADPTFYAKIMSKLDATSVPGVNEENDDEKLSEEDEKKHALDVKFYYAGGSCRFMFGFPTAEVIEILKQGVNSATNKLYGLQRDGDGGRFPVSSYTASLFAEECGAETIAQLATRLNASHNPSVDGHLFEWLFLASVPNRAVKLFGDGNVEDVLPKARVLSFDPKKRFKVLPNATIKANKSWLQPIAWNQGGYDAVYFDKDQGKVIFIQVTRSNKHDFKMRFFNEVLLKLKMAKMIIQTVEVFFVVKPAQYLSFKMGHIEDRFLLSKFDTSWTSPEEKHVKVRAF